MLKSIRVLQGAKHIYTIDVLDSQKYVCSGNAHYLYYAGSTMLPITDFKFFDVIIGWFEFDLSMPFCCCNVVRHRGAGVCQERRPIPAIHLHISLPGRHKHGCEC